MKSLFPEIDELITTARDAEDEAEELLKEALPPGTMVTFKFGNMAVAHPAEVVWTRCYHYPSVRLINLNTNTTREVPLDAIRGVESP